jgi:hypothetical protein
MRTIAQTSFAERIGRALGRMWRAGVRLDRKAHGHLVAQGMNANLAKGLLRTIEFALLAVLLYGTFWVVLLLTFAFTGAWVLRNADVAQPQSEWRDGMLGFGLYHPDGSRIDPHDPDEEV